MRKKYPSTDDGEIRRGTKEDALPDDGIVIKSDSDRSAVLDELATFSENETPWHLANQMSSPIEGGKGIVEYFFHAG